jgi:hypothetical protein
MKGIAPIILFLTACGFFYWRLISSPQILSDLNALPANVEQVFKFDPKKDPPIGSKIARFAGKAGAKARKPTLVVVGGSCTECSLHTFEPSTIDPRSYDRIAIVYQTTEDMIPSRIKAMRKPFEIITDPAGKLITTLNGVWYPRFYEISPDGTLIALQKDRGKSAPFVHLRR